MTGLTFQVIAIVVFGAFRTLGIATMMPGRCQGLADRSANPTDLVAPAPDRLRHGRDDQHTTLGPSLSPGVSNPFYW